MQSYKNISFPVKYSKKHLCV